MTSLLELFIEVEDLLKLRLHFLARFLKLKNGQVLVLEPSTLSTHVQLFLSIVHNRTVDMDARGSHASSQPALKFRRIVKR